MTSYKHFYQPYSISTNKPSHSPYRQVYTPSKYRDENVRTNYMESYGGKVVGERKRKEIGKIVKNNKLNINKREEQTSSQRLEG